MTAGRGLTGVLPVLSTPFADDDSVDTDSLAAEVRWLHSLGVDGLTVGMVSEVLRLTHDERRTVATTVCRLATSVTPVLPVVVSVGAESTATAVSLARHAQSVGAAAVMAIPPLSVALDADGLRGYFAAILRDVSLPVVVQDASGYVGASIAAATYVDLLDEFGADRVFAKPEAQPLGPRLSVLHEATGGQLRVFEGMGGSALVDAFGRGVVGTMPGPDVAWAVVALWRALVADRVADADDIHARLAALLSLQTSLDSYVAVEKHLLVVQGVIASTRRREPLGYTLDAPTADLAVRLMGRLRATVDGVGEQAPA
jgi:dihydrodipicolinate synthase/N-acetylneuraminate lyase